jgi:hypothetical protein
MLQQKPRLFNRGFQIGEGTLENSGGALWQEAPSVQLYSRSTLHKADV